MKYLSYLAAVTATISLSLQPMEAKDAGIAVSHLGVNNSLVHINSDKHYVMLPVQENIDDASVNLLLDGKVDKSFNVRLARNKVDYFVPVDISKYAGRDIVLDVATHHDRSSMRGTSEDVCWELISLSDNVDMSNKEKYRPAYHHSPLWGWMNDPNGMVWKDGVWHLCFQHNPYGSKWQNLSWGHATSPDLIHWTFEGDVLEPNGLGMVFSGSADIDRNNTAGFGKDAVVGMYTSAAATQQQSLVWSTDGCKTYNFYGANPVVAMDSEARDPNFFWHEPSGRWILLLAHALDHEMLIFSSPDMKEWTLESSFGKGLGAQNGVWECPDLKRLPIDGTNRHKWVLICNLNPGGIFGGSATQYFVGEFDGKTFRPDTRHGGIVSTKWMDFGKDHYATVSFHNAPDNRNVVIGWMSNWQYAAEVPTKQFRSANTLPRDISLFKAPDGEYYIKTVPSPELAALRSEPSLTVKSKALDSTPAVFELPSGNDGVCEIELTLDPQKNAVVNLSLSNPDGEEVVMTYSPSAKTFSFDRTNAGVSDFSRDFPAKVWAPTLSKSNLLKLRIFIDRSSIEVFDADGNFVMTNLVFPTSPYTALSASVEGGKAAVANLSVYPIGID